MDKFYLISANDLRDINALYFKEGQAYLKNDKPIFEEKPIDNSEVDKFKKCISILDDCLTEAPVDFLGTGDNWRAAEKEEKEWLKKWKNALKDAGIK